MSSSGPAPAPGGAPGAPSGLPPVPPNIGSILGSQLFGTLFNFALFGVLMVQVYIYRISFPNDNTKIKCLVYFVAIFEVVQTVMNGVDAYNWFGSGFGDVLVIASPGISPVYTPIFDSIMALIVQTFFCYRIYIINKGAWWFSLLILAVSITQAVGGITGGIEAFMLNNISVARQQKITSTLWLVGDAVADVMIAAAMSYLLLRARGAMHRHASDAVSRIVTLIVETNTLTTVVAVVSMILYAGLPNTTYFICPTMILGKLYANTLLLTFNNRAFIQKPTATTAFTQSSASSSRARSMMKSTPFSAGLSLSETSTAFSGVEMDVTVVSHSHSDKEYGHHGSAYKGSNLV